MGLSDPFTDFIPPADLPNANSYSTDPYLSYRPHFARSLPIQILIGGITLTLVTILLVQLLFTSPYHIRLARVNFFLQLSAAVFLLGSEIATLTILLNDTVQQSQKWPFMLEYISVDLPPLNLSRATEGWSLGGLIAWLSMNALVSALTQVRRLYPWQALPIPIHLYFFFNYRSHTSSYFPSCIPPASRRSSFSSCSVLSRSSPQGCSLRRSTRVTGSSIWRAQRGTSATRRSPSSSRFRSQYGASS